MFRKNFLNRNFYLQHFKRCSGSLFLFAFLSWFVKLKLRCWWIKGVSFSSGDALSLSTEALVNEEHLFPGSGLPQCWGHMWSVSMVLVSGTLPFVYVLECSSLLLLADTIQLVVFNLGSTTQRAQGWAAVVLERLGSTGLVLAKKKEKGWDVPSVLKFVPFKFHH